MKKYFAAAAVAIMVFAFSAFAASLEVDAGNLAVGSDSVGDCGGEADITYSHHTEDGDGLPFIDAAIVTFPDDSCDGSYVYFSSSFASGPAEIEGNQAVFVVTGGTEVKGTNEWAPDLPQRYGIPTADVEGEILLTVYSDFSQPGPDEVNGGQNPATPFPGTFGG